MSQAAPPCPTIGHFDHRFGGVDARPQEHRVRLVTLITLAVMAVEIAAGLLTGSMALLADGVHMGTHALALGLAAAAYVFARRHAHDPRFSLGTGKTGDLAGFASALMLGFTALLMIGHAVERLLNPQSIAYGEALLIAVIGLVVNVVSAVALTGGHEHHGHGHDHDHRHDHHHGHGHDNNLRAALVHVIADALTSVGAIIALATAWAYGWRWLDPAVAMVSAAVILVWAYGLLRDTGRVLLDTEAPQTLRRQVLGSLEADGDSRVEDLHMWSVGSGAVMLVASVVTHGDRQPDDYKAALPEDAGICHPIIEVRHCDACGP
ncbi:CDF family Co(II)/Ni(II) efflux transporter DmeF [Roseospira visakhapatnamensis]|uniref:Cation diffusion facilitator family transporter n=1 Tax=Roseospira visakhapatnamensis TaxID=390880 RepID=A0A7W6RCT2_9PROT|nr:CDF family Co(II)/Ni(II) efflux transporter DmeF [Roseospira visakhapatnamensis]MBB4265992.1 cation diffusion facilitator family transporter [Roseospira visakhapatnamensis]